MTAGTEIYKRPFHQRRKEKHAYNILADASIAAYQSLYGRNPTTACDIGCSAGALLYRLKERLPSMVTDGYDYSVNTADLVFEGTYREQDLNNYDGTARGAYDMLISQEVLEHVEPENTDKALQFITDLAIPGTLLIFGAARPGQRGTHHVNCIKKKAWIRLFTAKGWAYSLKAHLAYNGIIDRDDTVHRTCRYYKRNTICLIKT
jgi:2-polyprenyl-3-methyl-5-hydroxy-6-metoxy-1,4-benzoquinol methylase